MSTEDPKHDDQTRELEDSIDHLLDEVDTPRADGDEPAPVPDVPESAGESEDAQQTLDSLEAVEQSAQSLIEDAIDDLVEAAATTNPEPVPEPVPEAETEPNSEAILSDEVIDAALDALEDTPIAPTPEVPTDALSDVASDVAESLSPEPAPAPAPAPAAQPESTEAQPAPEDRYESDTDSLINDIADELTNNAPASEQPAADTQDPAPQPTQEAAQEPIQEATQEPAQETAQEIAQETAETQDETGPDEVNTVTDEAAEPRYEQADQDQAAIDDAIGSITDLDTTLAGIDDALLMGDFESPDGDTISADSLEQSDATSLLDQLGISDLGLETPAAEDDAPPTETPQPTPPAPAPAAEETQPESNASTTEPAPTPEPVSIDAESAAKARAQEKQSHQRVAERETPKPVTSKPLGQDTDDEVLSIWATAQRFIVTHAMRLYTLARVQGGPYSARLVLLINKPIKDRPAQLRDSIGYLALWTALLAMILWVYLAFIREIPTPVPSQAPTRVMLPGESGDPLVNNEHP